MKSAGIDWEQVRDRLRASENAVEESLGAGPSRIEEAYRQRAMRLAIGQADRQTVSAGLAVLVFGVARERYAVELKELTEVLPYAPCTPVPGARQPFLGLINLRGELRPVVDLGRLFSPSVNGGDSGFVLMLRSPGREIGLKVDHVERLGEIRPEEVSAPAQGRYLKGVVSGTLMLLSVDAVLEESFSKKESSIA